MFTEDVLTKKKLNCIDLVIIALSLDKVGIKYKINDDGSLSIFDVDYVLIQTFDDHKTSGYIGDVYVDGHFDIRNYPDKTDLICNKYSKRLIFNY